MVYEIVELPKWYKMGRISKIVSIMPILYPIFCQMGMGTQTKRANKVEIKDSVTTITDYIILRTQ